MINMTPGSEESYWVNIYEVRELEISSCEEDGVRIVIEWKDGSSVTLWDPMPKPDYEEYLTKRLSGVL